MKLSRSYQLTCEAYALLTETTRKVKKRLHLSASRVNTQQVGRACREEG